MSLILFGFLGSLCAGLMTVAGALPMLYGKSITQRSRDILLGFAAGVMLAASFFSLIVPSIDISTERYGDGALPAAIAAIGIVLGAAFVAALNHYLPHEHFVQGREGPPNPSLRRIWLFIIAITIHNFPEGLAVGVGFGSGDTENALALAMGIGIQNAPEGLAVAVALLGAGYSKKNSFMIASLTGLVEPIGGVLGAAIIVISAPLLPWALVFAAGAMIYVISHEIIPEIHKEGFQNEATTGLITGLVLMLFLDVWLG